MTRAYDSTQDTRGDGITPMNGQAESIADTVARQLAEAAAEKHVASIGVHLGRMLGAIACVEIASLCFAEVVRDIRKEIK